MQKLCIFPGCGTRIYARELCLKHYERRRRHGDPAVTLRPRDRTCALPTCASKHYARGWCHAHYERWRRHGDTVPRAPRRAPGEPGPARTRCNGYIRRRLPEHPNADRQGNVWEHVLVMSAQLGRPLFADETVHHRNGVRDDNRLSNLELWSSSHPPGQRVEEKLQWAREMIARYAA